MQIEGKSISFDQAAEILGQGRVTKEVSAADLTAKWVSNPSGTTVLVQGLGDQVLQLEIAAAA